MKAKTLFTVLSLYVLLIATAEARKKCRCRGKRGPRGFRGLKGDTGPAGPAGPAGGGGGANCQLIHDSGPSNVATHQTGDLSFSIPQLAIGSTCPVGFQAVSCDCHMNTFENGSDQVRTKILGWGIFQRSCLCNYEYLPGFDEKVEISAQVHCIKLECN